MDTPKQGQKPTEFPKNELKHVGTIKIRANVGKFVAREHFIRDTSKKRFVKIARLGYGFRENFLGKVEKPIVEMAIRYQELVQENTSDKLIIAAALGGPEKAEMTLYEMFGLMALHPYVKNGPLLTNGYANIFYIRDVEGVLQAVRCYWDQTDGGWKVGDFPIDDETGWRDGGRVFSSMPVEIKNISDLTFKSLTDFWPRGTK